MRRTYTWLILLLLAASLTCLLWPMGSPQFAIGTDEQALAEKQKYLAAPLVPDTAQRPNILLITVDDLGMADCSLYEEGNIETPQIDRLGEQGVVMENAYVTAPVCSPSRAALITGRYQHRYGYEFTMQARYLKNRLEYLAFKYVIDSDPWIPKWMSRVPDREAIRNQGLPVSELTLAEVLKKHGYKTGIIGKWHLGWGEERLPSEFGFDEQYGFFTSHSLYIPEGTERYADQKIDGDWTDPHIWSGQRKGPHAIYRNNVEVEENGYLTDRITEESIGFMEDHSEEPFFLWISYNAPHTPLQAPQEYVDRYSHIEDPVKRMYRAMVASLDDNIGRLMEYLSEQGMDRNTLVFFISDNGGAEYTLTTDNGPYEGGKNTEFEGGLKVPMIVRWTGKLPAGDRFEPMVSAMDIFTTSLSAADAEYLPGRELDGKDLLPYLTDPAAGSPHAYLFWQRGISQVTRGDRWKLMINGYSGDTLLYDLQENKYENPDVSSSYYETIRELDQAHREWAKMRREPLWPSVIYFTAIKDGKRYYFEQ